MSEPNHQTAKQHLSPPNFNPIPINLRNLGTNRSAATCITPAFGESLAQAASVCLDERGHASPTKMVVAGTFNMAAQVDWDRPSDQSRRCWNDDQYATEHGAYGVAALLVESCGLEMLQRSKKKTGFDFWLGPAESKGTLFQGLIRCEVSGIRSGNAPEVDSRVRQKLKQTERSEGEFPAVVVVVEFGYPITKIVEKWKK